MKTRKKLREFSALRFEIFQCSRLTGFDSLFISTFSRSPHLQKEIKSMRQEFGAESIQLSSFGCLFIAGGLDIRVSLYSLSSVWFCSPWMAFMKQWMEAPRNINHIKKLHTKVNKPGIGRDIDTIWISASTPLQLKNEESFRLYLSFYTIPVFAEVNWTD